MDWTTEAEERQREVPLFVSPMVRKRIERLAGEEGLARIDGRFYERARARFGQR